MRQRTPSVELRAWARREASVEELRSHAGLVDLATGDLGEAVSGADCVVLAMPTGHMADVVGRIAAFASVDGAPALVTDVGSVKGPVVREIGPLVRERGGCFLGSHPMAGSEKKGLAFAEAGLFDGAAVILTPEPGDEARVPALQRFWEQLGGVVSILEPAVHDELVAGISHLPHLVAAALVRSVLGRQPDSVELSGGGFRDTTRVAGGPEEMWSGILADNAPAVSAQLGQFIEELRSWKEALDLLDRDRLISLLSEARRLRGTLPDPGKRSPLSRRDV